jgi:hypothetical protein
MNAVVYSPHHSRCDGVVYDVSDHGLLLSTVEHYAPGNWICLDLPDDAGDLVPLKVARVNYQPGVGWLVGCVYAYGEDSGTLAS